MAGVLICSLFNLFSSRCLINNACVDGRMGEQMEGWMHIKRLESSCYYAMTKFHVDMFILVFKTNLHFIIESNAL